MAKDHTEQQKIRNSNNCPSPSLKCTELLWKQEKKKDLKDRGQRLLEESKQTLKSLMDWYEQSPKTNLKRRKLPDLTLKIPAPKKCFRTRNGSETVCLQSTNLATKNPTFLLILCKNTP